MDLPAGTSAEPDLPALWQRRLIRSQHLFFTHQGHQTRGIPLIAAPIHLGHARIQRHQDAVGVTTAGVVSGAAIVQTSTCGPQRNQPCPTFHGNGVVDVTPQWSSGCFGCH